MIVWCWLNGLLLSRLLHTFRLREVIPDRFCRIRGLSLQKGAIPSHYLLHHLIMRIFRTAIVAAFLIFLIFALLWDGGVFGL